VKASPPDRQGASLETELRLLLRKLTHVADHIAEPAAITSRQSQVLLELVDNGPLRLGDLGTRIRATAPTASRAVDHLVAAKLVKRQPDPYDRRAVLNAATPRGIAWVERRRAVVINTLNSALAVLSEDEQRTLLDLTAKLNAEIE
jgi:DNA-binding MarR family transcriptional regulator